MTRAELIEKLSRQFPKLTLKDVDLAARCIQDGIRDALAHGQRVEIRGFGSFSVSYRKARIGRNPKSGEKVAVSGKYAPHFKSGKELRDRVASTTQNLPDCNLHNHSKHQITTARNERNEHESVRALSR